MISVRVLLFCTLPGLVLLGVSPTVRATGESEPINQEAVQLSPQTQNGVPYLTGGIGQDETQALLHTHGYNLHIVSVIGPKGEYMPDVDITIQKAGGESVLSLTQVGPMVYVKLPAGKYEIVSRLNGREDRQSVVLNGKAGQTVDVRWRDE
ncbi:carboxypeptidase regulatory-like domain-containing protein [Pseudomonas gingeri]|uniref:Carboxypeptidase regulatory-like domain-containing protein n=1 Tax=Pseudomonas gingeri TaxID=117681 RepID=A0A7Y8C3V1_9PSED|nr:carboxypeptidase regulatory-like domain-containing protein [Pseudomonas gingeri]NWA23289.1 carboxypeptidase regulatory-like domain-containing protein [Pseudomonas gingeri]NWB98985.1 carboxypeptidase regulatory-like domain-containing protein [Pseudomonas gingeri]NWD68607.1 carboxypeptidase regulatory-like domain-containing protein [Pseudomonas gingeri]NWD76955.1 carboxypeptidase regulatory-like domain-containing protein [Pseudomonas gingeri]